MKAALSMGKLLTGGFWLLVLVNLWMGWEAPLGSVINWAAVAILVAHAVEMMVFVRRFGEQLTDLRFHQFMVLVFGIFHLLPFLLTPRKTTPPQKMP